MRLAWLRDLAAVQPRNQSGRSPLSGRVRTAPTPSSAYGRPPCFSSCCAICLGEPAFARGIRRLLGAEAVSRGFLGRPARGVRAGSGRRSARSSSNGSRPGAPTVRIVSAQTLKKGISINLEQSQPPMRCGSRWRSTSRARSETRWVETEREKQRSPCLHGGTASRAPRSGSARMAADSSVTELPPILRQWFLAPSAAVLFATRTNRPRRAAGPTTFRISYSRSGP